jgi:D-glycero-D-manno-heptose 1,7-bisphosphate phosphatase
MSAPPCVLLDRDGVINVDRPGGVRRLEGLELEPGAAAAIARLTRAGYRVLVLTNQAVVGRGELSSSDLLRIHEAIATAVATAAGRIDGWYVCPHSAEAACECRKPRPGLIERAHRDWEFEPAVTWLVGDDERDVDAALAAGCQPLLVRTGKGAMAAAARPEVPVVADLAAAVSWILQVDAAVDRAGGSG